MVFLFKFKNVYRIRFIHTKAPLPGRSLQSGFFFLIFIQKLMLNYIITYWIQNTINSFHIRNSLNGMPQTSCAKRFLCTMWSVNLRNANIVLNFLQTWYFVYIIMAIRISWKLILQGTNVCDGLQTTDKVSTLRSFCVCFTKDSVHPIRGSWEKNAVNLIMIFDSACDIFEWKKKRKFYM